MSEAVRELGPEDRLAAHTKQARESSSPAMSMNGLADSALQGVTVSFLAQVFRIDNAAVKRKLVNCPTVDSRMRGTTQVQHLYDLATAAKYLVESDIDPMILIGKIKRDDLPPAISTAYWDALLKKQKFEENAGDLWRTGRVWDVLADTFQKMKFTMQLWSETVERQTGLTDEQRDILRASVDALQQELYDTLIRSSDQKATGSQLDEIPQNMRLNVFEQEDALDDDAAALL